MLSTITFIVIFDIFDHTETFKMTNFHGPLLCLVIIQRISSSSKVLYFWKTKPSNFQGDNLLVQFITCAGEGLIRERLHTLPEIIN